MTDFHPMSTVTYTINLLMRRFLINKKSGMRLEEVDIWMFPEK